MCIDISFSSDVTTYTTTTTNIITTITNPCSLSEPVEQLVSQLQQLHQLESPSKHQEVFILQLTTRCFADHSIQVSAAGNASLRRRQAVPPGEDNAQGDPGARLESVVSAVTVSLSV